MNSKNILTVVALFGALAVLAAVLLLSMSWVADRGSTATVASPTPALADVFTIVTSTETTVETDPTVPPTRTPVPYDSNTMMYLVFAGFDLSPGFGPLNTRTLDALERIREEKDTLQVRVIIESLRNYFSPDIITAAIVTLVELTGQTAFGDDWKAWSEWIGRHSDEYPVPSEYGEWKINYLRQIDGRFGAFLSPALSGQSDVDLTEVEWGGVIPDGIPPLENPAHAKVDDEGAEYLEGDERVIGVSINGEHRAYPLRIVNAHELVNDVLGGEPLSLTW